MPPLTAHLLTLLGTSCWLLAPYMVRLQKAEAGTDADCRLSVYTALSAALNRSSTPGRL